MNIADAQQLVDGLMAKHGLTSKGWAFRFDSAPKRFGKCCHFNRSISMSRVLTLVNEEPAVRDTILHEIAHALVGSGHDHDRVWQAKAIEIGCNGKSKYNMNGVKDTVEYKPWKLVCPRCKREFPRARRVNRPFSCSPCGIQKNGKRGFDRDLLLVWQPTEQWEGPSARPKSGVTLKVWEIADMLQGVYSGTLPPKQMVVQMCGDQGINPATASVQYGKWVKSLEDEKGENKSEIGVDFSEEV